MTKRQITRGGTSAIGMVMASLLLMGAWWASAGSCAGLQCVPAGVVAAMSSETPFVASTIGPDDPSQLGSLLLLGFAFGLAARLLKRQRVS